MMAGSGCAAWAKGTEEESAGHHGKQDDCRKDSVFPRGIRHEGNAGGFGQSRVIAVIIRLAHKTPRHRPFIDSQAQNHQQVQAHEGQQQSGYQEDVQRKEARKRGAADDRPAQQEMHHGSAGERNAADDGSADAQAPVGVLIEAQDLSGEGHAQGEHEQKDARDPGQLARIFVCAKEKDLHHVNEHDGDHEVRSPSVHGAQKPAQPQVVVDELQAGVGIARAGRIDQGQQNAGHHLQDQQHHGRAAKDVPPTGGRRRRRMPGHLCHRLQQAGAFLEPLEDAQPALLQVFHLGPLLRRGGRRLNGKQARCGRLRCSLDPRSFARAGLGG